MTRVNEPIMLSTALVEIACSSWGVMSINPVTSNKKPKDIIRLNLLSFTI